MAPHLADITRIGNFCHAAGLLTSLRNFASGTAELWEIYKKGGINRKDKELSNPKSHKDIVDRSVEIGLAHGALSFAAVGASTCAVWPRRKAAGFAPGRAGILLSTLMLPAVALNAVLGGELVYGKRVGVQRVGGGLEEKWEGKQEAMEIRGA